MLIVIFSRTLFGQSPLRQGELQLNFGVGFSSWGLPIYGGLDYGMAKDFSIGGEVSYRSYSEDFGRNKYDHTILGIAANGNYHLNSVLNIGNNWDVYVGLNIGFFNWSSPNGYGGSHNSGLGLGAQLGARYYFTQKWGVTLEFGGGNAFNGGKFGLSLKL